LNVLLEGVVGSTAYGLADQPDQAAVESWLHRVRAEYLSTES